MKNIIISLVVFFIHGYCFSQSDWSKGYVSEEICTQNLPWGLVYEETFDNNTYDESKWIKRVPWGDPGLPNVLGYNLPENIIVENGKLVLQAKEEPGNYPVPWYNQNPSYVYYPYTSSQMWTKQRFKYGKFEIRCKIPKGQGFNTAFWLFGNCKQEIDIFEIGEGKTAKQHITYHHFSNCNDPITGETDFRKCMWHNCITSGNCGVDGLGCTDFSDGFHTFSVEWDEFQITVRMDGNAVFTEAKYYSLLGQHIPNCSALDPFPSVYLLNPYFLTNPMNMILQLAVVSDSDPFGPGPNGDTPFPARFEVDYVRVYKRIEHNSIKVITNIELNALEGSVITGKEITFGGGSNAVVTNNTHIIAAATDKIVLDTGFKVDLGSSFCGKTVNN